MCETELIIVDLMERHVHIQSLLELQKGTTADLENSLKQEKNLTRQLQVKVQSLQRHTTELEQSLRVCFMGNHSIGIGK